MIWHKIGHTRPWLTFEVMLHFMKTLCLHNVDIREKIKDSALNKLYIAKKEDFEILRSPYVTFDLGGHTSCCEIFVSS